MSSSDDFRTGALVLFVGLLSFFFLKRRLYLYQWSSLFIVMGGVSLVGLAGSMIKQEPNHNLTSASNPQHGQSEGEPEVTSVLIGILFVLFAQVL
jgi:drug/metabolite transporter (DMT)-like permease